jgi:hypothetical protein
MLTRKCRSMGCIISEVTEIDEIELYPGDMNIEDGPSPRKSWKHLVQNLRSPVESPVLLSCVGGFI